MGFGIVLLGYLLTLFDVFGGGLVGCPLMVYGFSKLNKINTRFGLCAVFAIISMYEPVLQVLAILKLVDSTTWLFNLLHIASYGIKLALLVTLYFSVLEIARKAKAADFEHSAKLRLFFNIFAYGAMVLLANLGDGRMNLIITVLMVISGIVNLLFIWDCAVKITTPTQILKEKEQLRRIDDEERKKAEKRKNRDMPKLPDSEDSNK